MKKFLCLLLLALLICGTFGQWNINEPCTRKSGDGTEAGEGFRRHPNERECQKYISCVGNVGHERQCLGNHHFDRCLENRCVPPSALASCTDKCILCPLTGIANFPSDTPNQCHKYYKCTNGEQLESECANGMLFDVQTRTCRPFQDVANCQINTCLLTEGFDFAYAPDLKDCRKFYVCEKGAEVFSLTCATGQKYSMHEKDRIGEVEFNGRCVSETGFVECFNGQNFPTPEKITA